MNDDNEWNDDEWDEWWDDDDEWRWNDGNDEMNRDRSEIDDEWWNRWWKKIEMIYIMNDNNISGDKVK